MSKLQMFGNLEDELVKIAYEKGWIKNADDFTGQQPMSKAQAAPQQSVMPELTGPPVPATQTLKPMVIGNYYKDPMIGQVQTALNNFFKNYSIPSQLKVDSAFGPQTAAAWNHYAKTLGNITPVKPDASQIPSVKDAQYLITTWPEKAEKAVAPASQPVQTGAMPKEPVPGKADDGMANAKMVINELISLANDLDDAGEKVAADEVDKQLKIYKEAVDKLYDITGETGKQLIESSHDKSPVIIPAKDDGGLVENVVERQEMIMETVKHQPTGKFAGLMAKLIVTANKLEDEGDVEGAKIVDKTIADLCSQVSPFVDRNSTSKVVGSEDFKTLNKKAEMENPETYIEEALKYIYQVKEVDPVRATSLNLHRNKIYNTLKPFVMEIKKIPFHTDNAKALNEYIAVLNKLLPVLKTLGGDFLSIDDKAREYFINLNDSINVSITNAKSKINIIEQQSGEKTQTGGKEQESKSTKQPVGPKEEMEDKERKNYIYNLDLIINSIKNSPNKIGGVAKAGKFIQIFIDEKKKAITYDISLIEKRNNTIFNYLMPVLKQKGIITAAFEGLMKKADAFDDAIKSLVPSGKMPGKQPGKGTAKPGLRPSMKSDSNIKAMQKALIDSGTSVGPKNDDGVWGSQTMAGWNNFVDKAQQIAGSRTTGLTKHNDPRTPPSIPEMQIAMRWANVIKQRTNKTLNVIEFELSGKKLTTNDLANPNTFLNALRRERLVLENIRGLSKEQTFDLIDKYAMALYKDITEGEQNEYIRGRYGDEAIEQIKGLIVNNIYNKVDTLEQPSQKDTNAPSTKSDLINPFGKKEEKNEGWSDKTKSQQYDMPKNSVGPNEIYQKLMRLSQQVSENSNTFIRKAEALGKDPKQYANEIGRMLGKLMVALDNSYGEFMRQFGKERGQTNFDRVKSVSEEIQNKLESIENNLGVPSRNPYRGG